MTTQLQPLRHRRLRRLAEAHLHQVPRPQPGMERAARVPRLRSEQHGPRGARHRGLQRQALRQRQRTQEPLPRPGEAYGSQFARRGDEGLVYFALEKKSVFSWIRGEIGLRICYYDEIRIKGQLGFQSVRSRRGSMNNHSASFQWNEDIIFVTGEPLEDSLVLLVEDRTKKMKKKGLFFILIINY
ncbi:unnamed protein product [Linum trigynum]|uniref:Uncharacterized protein n=1 Tax=Linum trigynum TaxID=586398 RepID=A0AAV2FFZ8_9ROSI